MTENKRFTLEEFGLNFIVNDNGRNLTAKQTVDKLNQLYEENEQLKEDLHNIQKAQISDIQSFEELLTEIEKLKSICQDHRDHANDFKADCVRLEKENEQLKSDLKDCKNLKSKRLNKIRNHRAVIEDLGGSIRAYKGKIEQTNEKIDKIKEAMEDTGALTKRQLEEILND